MLDDPALIIFVSLAFVAAIFQAVYPSKKRDKYRNPNRRRYSSTPYRPSYIADVGFGRYSDFPYSRAPNFLTPAELHFYQSLRVFTGDRAAIVVKVRLGDLFIVTASDSRKTIGYANKINRKHVDYVLCDPITMSPIVAIELDDSSHQREDRQARDEFVDGVFSAAGLPLVHVPVKRQYTRTQFEETLDPYLNGTANVPPQSAAVQSPPCPTCGGTMVLKTVESGKYEGRKFWACSTYPTCQGKLIYIASCSAAEKLEDPIREYHGVKESRNDGTETPQVYGAIQI